MSFDWGYIMQNLGNNIVNMLKCRRGEHPLFRSYGLGSEVDTNTGWDFGRVQVELKRYYPSLQLKTFSVEASANGEFQYILEVEGV